MTAIVSILKAAIRRFLQMHPAQRFQFVLELASTLLLFILTCLSVWAKDWQHAAIFFCLATMVTTLAERRIVGFFKAASLDHLAPNERRQAFDDLTRSPKEWVFRGGSGRWFRNYAIPAVAKAARTKSNIRALLVDPRDEAACKSFADYRKRSSWYSDHTVTDRGIQAEVLATIFVLCRAHFENRLMVRTSLTNSYSPLRIDANGDQMIITTPDRQIDPIKVTSEHWLYHALVDEVNEAAIAGARIIWPESLSWTGELSVEALKATLGPILVRTNDGREVPLLSMYADDSLVDWTMVLQATSTTDHKVEHVG